MKIKAGLLVGYNGVGYHGLQLNKEVNTIEKAISECLFEVGAISERNASDPTKIHLRSSSRTDKGVHAAQNLVSMKICVHITEELTKNLRESLLKKSIYLYKIVRLTKTAIPCKMIESRVYEYLVPTFFLKEGNFHEEARSMMMSFDVKQSRAEMKYPISVVAELSGYRAPREDISILESIFQRYIGTKDFHNFTKAGNCRGSNRYIKSISVSEAYAHDDVEYVKVCITGQSFMLHQIRKMIFFAMLLCKYSRGGVDEGFKAVFGKESAHVPKGPAEYLILDKLVFNRSNRGFGSTYCPEVDETQREEFKEKEIYSQIYCKENLIEFFAKLDSVRFYKDNMVFLR